jgi:hypothetical protein
MRLTVLLETEPGSGKYVHAEIDFPAEDGIELPDLLMDGVHFAEDFFTGEVLEADWTRQVKPGDYVVAEMKSETGRKLRFKLLEDAAPEVDCPPGGWRDTIRFLVGIAPPAGWTGPPPSHKGKKKKPELRKATASDLANFQPGPIRRPNLSEFQKGIMAWAFAVVGHYLIPTLEQWELGFMRDSSDQEVNVWHRLAFAFVDYHRKRGLALRSREEEKRLAGNFVAVSLGNTLEQPDEDEIVRACLQEPDGWEKERKRVRALAKANRWKPPTHIDWKPYAKA